MRTYTDEPVSDSDFDKLARAASDTHAEFGGRYHMQVVRSEALADGRVPSTYGCIKGARTFMLLWCGEDTYSQLSGGYAMERLVLVSTSLGLGTCWLGGTFSARDFGTCQPSGAEGMKLIAVIPVGHAAGKEHLISRMMGAVVGSRHRKPMNRLFLSAEGEKVELSKDNPCHEALEMMRQAPSSTNSQPWRALVSSQGVEFFKAKDGHLTDIDMGIGLCHFAIAMDSKGKRGRFIATPPDHLVVTGWKYVTTYVGE